MNEHVYARLSKGARELYARVVNEASSSGGSVLLSSSESRPARELVHRELCFYSGDYDHLMAYRPGASAPAEEDE
jgi:hypothetical protein